MCSFRKSVFLGLHEEFLSVSVYDAAGESSDLE